MELPKIVAAGTYDGSFAHKNRTVSKKRRTSMFEIEIISEEGGTAFIEGKAYPVMPSRVICAKPGQERYTKMPFRCLYVHFILHGGPLYDLLTNVPDSFEARNIEGYRKLFERLVGHFALLSEKEEILLQSILLELIYSLGKDGERALQKASSPSPEIEKALSFIQEHLTEDLSLEVLGKEVALSPNYFHNAFKRAVGKTLREYVEEQRIKKAIDLMLTTDQPLTKIALDAGFSSQSYFSFVFKRRMKMTPGSYLKKHFKKYEE
jgi:AraC-like DNA-binding protein